MRASVINKTVLYKGQPYRAELKASQGIGSDNGPDEITGYFVSINKVHTGPEIILGTNMESNIQAAKDGIKQGIEIYISMQQDFLKDWNGIIDE